MLDRRLTNRRLGQVIGVGGPRSGVCRGSRVSIVSSVVRAISGFAACICTACILAAAGNVQPPVQAPTFPATAGNTTRLPSPAYPLKRSSNNRYLIDQNNVPFLMVGDAPQTLIANLSEAEATTYMVNRQNHGINTLWINLLCNYSGNWCNSDATTFDGVAPFIVAGDLSTPNPAYFQRADDMLNIAAAKGMLVLLDPIETSSWLGVLRANGTANAFAYGQWLGNRYKNFPNIIWMHGNDFLSWQNAADNALVQAVARGIRSSDASHMHTIELNYWTSGSLDDPTWAPLTELDAAYTYRPTYAQVLSEYNRSNFKPVFMVEANYEFDKADFYVDGGSAQNLRRQEYWTMLSGATGQVYGSAKIWPFVKGWKTYLDTPGMIQLSYMKNLFAELKWYDLVPDQTHTVVTSGYDALAGYVAKFSTHIARSPGPSGYPGRTARIFFHVKQLTGFGSIITNTYAPAARTSDGSLVIAYMPTVRTITVDMSKLAGSATARWYDPTNGKYVDAGASLFANSGARQFTPPGNNSAGDGDWVLVLEVSPAR
jgi:hypothetical protein